MIYKVEQDQRDLAAFDVPGATVQVSDPIVGVGDKLAAGFTDFFMLEGHLEIQVAGQEPVQYEAGDLGYIEKGTQTIITVPERAYLVHVTHPAWR